MNVAVRSLLAVLVAILLLPELRGIGAAWIFRGDPRRPSNVALVGTITFDMPEGRSAGTAFLVGDCAIMTSFHVVFGPWYVTALRPPSHQSRGKFVLTQENNAKEYGHETVAIPAIWGDYTGPDRSIRKPAEDWVVLALEDCLGSRFGFLKPFDAALNDDIPDRGGFSAVGYSSGGQMIDADCSIQAIRDGRAGSTIQHDCAAMSGDSGSPIIRRGTARVVAMVSSYHADWGTTRCRTAAGIAGGAWTPQCTNVAVPLDAGLIDRIEGARDAILIQHWLLQLGYDAGALGVVEGPLLDRAIRRFQRDSELVPTGSIDANLYRGLMARHLGVCHAGLDSH